jgi:hypothetical protein
MAKSKNIPFDVNVNVLKEKEFKSFFLEVSAIMKEIKDNPKSGKSLSVQELMDKHKLISQLPDDLVEVLKPVFKGNIYNPGKLEVQCTTCLACLVCLTCAEVNAASGLASLIGILGLQKSLSAA